MLFSNIINDEVIVKRAKTKQNTFALNLAMLHNIKNRELSGSLNRVYTTEKNLDNNILDIKKSCSRTLYCGNQYLLYSHKEKPEETVLESNAITRYCKSRSCLTCLRNKTADLINGYKHINDKQTFFLTLTLKNCNYSELINVINTMTHNIRRIQDLSRKKFNNYSGVRKLEITYNNIENTYHPHFHIIIDNESTADFILNQWLSITKKYLKEIGIYASSKGQDIRQASADGNDFLELCKYFTKLYKSGSESIHIDSFINIIASLRKVRILQPFGHISKKSTETNFKSLKRIDDYYIEFYNNQYVILNNNEIDTFLTPPIYPDKLYQSALNNNPDNTRLSTIFRTKK